jgi:hypothetical protein
MRDPLSVAEQLTVVVPRARWSPTAGLQDGVGGSASSGSVALTV